MPMAGLPSACAAQAAGGLRHSRGRRLADRPVRFEDRGVHAEPVDFGLLAVADQAPGEEFGTAGDSGDLPGEQSARTTLRGGKLQSLFAQQSGDYRLQRLVGQGIDGPAQLVLNLRSQALGDDARFGCGARPARRWI